MTDASSTLAIVVGKDLTLWSSVTGARIEKFRSQHNVSDGEVIESLSWNHNGQVLAVCYSDTVALMEAKEGKTLETINIARPLTVAFGARSRYLCIATRSSGVSVWDLKKLKVVRQFEMPSSQKETLLHACFDPLDRVVCTLAPNEVSIFQLSNARLLGTIPNPTPQPDQSPAQWTCWDMIKDGALGTICALGASDGLVWITDYSSITPLDIACNTSSDSSSTGVHSSSPSIVQTPLFHSRSTILGVAFSSTLSTIATLSPPTSVQVMAALSADRLAVYAWQSNGLCLFSHEFGTTTDSPTCLSWNGEIIAIGFCSGSVIMVDWKNSAILHRLSMSTAHSTAPIRQLAFGPHINASASALSSAIDSLKTTTMSSAPVYRHFSSDPLPKSVPLYADTTATSEGAHSQNGISTTTTPEESVNLPPSVAASIEALVRQMIQQESSRLQQDVRKSFVSLQVDLMQQFQGQADEVNRLLSQQTALLNQVVLENQLLRTEISRLRTEQHQRQFAQQHHHQQQQQNTPSAPPTTANVIETKKPP